MEVSSVLSSIEETFLHLEGLQNATARFVKKISKNLKSKIPTSSFDAI